WINQHIEVIGNSTAHEGKDTLALTSVDQKWREPYDLTAEPYHDHERVLRLEACHPGTQPLRALKRCGIDAAFPKSHPGGQNAINSAWLAEHSGFESCVCLQQVASQS